MSLSRSAALAAAVLVAACGAETPTGPPAAPPAEAPVAASVSVEANAGGFDPLYYGLGIVDPAAGLVCIARPTPEDGVGGGTRSHPRSDVQHRTTHDATATVGIHEALPIPGSPGAYRAGALLYSGTGRMNMSAWGTPGVSSYRTSAIVKAAVVAADPSDTGAYDAVCQIVEGPVLNWTYVSVTPAKGKGRK